MLALHFIEKFSEEHKKQIKLIGKDALNILISYEWPGNVRELGNVIERAVVLSHGETITPDYLPDKLKKSGGEQDTVEVTSTLKTYISDYEKTLLFKIYEAHNKNKEETAKSLGIDLATLYRKFKKHGIEE